MSVLKTLLSKTISTEAKDDKKWSGGVTANDKWHPPAGLFDKSAATIAKTLKENSDSEKQAMSRLNFYINRAGKNLSEKDKERLNDAKDKLKTLYAKDKKISKESADYGKTLRW